MGVAMSNVISKDIGPLHEGTIISIKAQIPLNAKRFSIDLVGPDESVAFHFSLRFDETPQVVLCNTWTPWWLWWKEERVTKVPFSPNKPFKMTITVRNKCYEVSVDGRHFLDFDHRIPYHIVQKVKFRGNVDLEDFSYTSNQPPNNPHENIIYAN